MQDYKIIVNGRKQGLRAYNAYAAVRSIMCWYTVGTFFTVLDSKNKANVFQKVTTSDPVTGYSDLIQIA